MKNIFYIHSPVTYLVSVATVRTLSLPEENVLFICDGFQSPYGKIKIVNLNSFYPKKGFFLRLFAFLRYFNKASLVDKIITDFTAGAVFIAYIPVMRFIEKVIATHPKCIRFNFIEEGLAHYYTGETLTSLSVECAGDPWRWQLSRQQLWKSTFSYLLSSLRGYNARLRTLPFSYSSYRYFPDVSYFALTEQAFPMAPKENIQLIKLPQNLMQDTLSLNLDNSIVWIGDNGVDYYGYSKELYFSGIREGFIHYLKKRGVGEIYIKFHRNESPFLRIEQIQLFENHEIKAKVIPDTVIMEATLAGAQNVVLCGVYSSLLFYADTMGHKTYTIYNLLKPEYEKNLLGKDISFFWERVKNIETAI